MEGVFWAVLRVIDFVLMGVVVVCVCALFWFGGLGGVWSACVFRLGLVDWEWGLGSSARGVGRIDGEFVFLLCGFHLAGVFYFFFFFSFPF